MNLLNSFLILMLTLLLSSPVATTKTTTLFSQGWQISSERSKSQNPFSVTTKDQLQMGLNHQIHQIQSLERDFSTINSKGCSFNTEMEQNNTTEAYFQHSSGMKGFCGEVMHLESNQDNQLEMGNSAIFSTNQLISRKEQLILRDDNTLVDLLLYVVKKEMDNCDLLIAFDEGFSDPLLLQRLVALPNTKQVLYISSTKDLSSVMWTSSQCRGYIFLCFVPQSLLEFVDQDLDSWDYSGRYVFAGPSFETLEKLVSSKKGKKTENIIGVVQSSIPGEWSIYMNQLFYGDKVQRITMWKKGRLTSKAVLFPDKLVNLREAELKITTFKWEPEVMYYNDADGNRLFLYGIDIAVVNTLVQALNFTPVYQEPPNGELWGDQTENGTWTGMMGMISQDEADMCFPLYVSVTRLGILDYTTPYKLQKSCFVVKTEPPLPNWQALSYPFNPWTWMSLLIGLIISGPILFLLASGARQFGKEKDAFRTLFQCCHYTLGLHLTEPQESLPERPTTQIYIIFLWLYCFILTVAYSSNLTAFLTVKKPPPRMETLKDLRDSGMAVTAASAFYKSLFTASPDETLHDLAEKYEVVNDQEEIFHRIREGKSSYPENEGYLEFVIATKLTKAGGLPQARILEECYALHSAAMALQNHSPLKRRFDQVIDGMISGGLIRRFLINTLQIAKSTKEYGTSEEDTDQEKNEETLGTLVPLSLDHMQGLFFILIIGWTLSVVAFLLESLT